MSIRRIRISAAAVGLVLLGAGCSGEKGIESFPPVSTEDEVPAESGTTPSSTTATTVDPSTSSSHTTTSSSDSIPKPTDGEAFDEYIATRVEAYFEVRDQASMKPSPDPESDFPELLNLAASPQLETTVEATRELYAEGRAYQEVADPAVGTATSEEHRTSGVKTNDGNKVTVFNCEVDDDEIIDVESGEVVIAGVLTILRVVTLEKIGSDWKVVDTEVTQKIEGVAGCYLASEAEFPY